MRLAALLIALSFTSPASFAQVLYGTLTGSVVDASNAVVPNAKIEAVNTSTGVDRQTTPMAPSARSFSLKMFF